MLFRSSIAKTLVGDQVEYNKQLQSTFGESMDEAVSAAELDQGTAKDRLERARTGQLPEGAAAKISALKDKFADITKRVESEQAVTGRRGRGLTTELEAARASGSLAAQLQEGELEEAQRGVRESTRNVAGLSQTRLAGLEDRSGELLADLELKDLSGRLSLQEQQMLNDMRTTQTKNQRLLDVTTSKGAAGIASGQQFRSDQIGDIGGELAARRGISSDFLDLESNVLSQQGTQSRSASSALDSQAALSRKRALADQQAAQDAISSGLRSAGTFAAGGMTEDGGFDTKAGFRSLFGVNRSEERRVGKE